MFLNTANTEFNSEIASAQQESTENSIEIHIPSKESISLPIGYVHVSHVDLRKDGSLVYEQSNLNVEEIATDLDLENSQVKQYVERHNKAFKKKATLVSLIDNFDNNNNNTKNEIVKENYIFEENSVSIAEKLFPCESEEDKNKYYLCGLIKKNNSDKLSSIETISSPKNFVHLSHVGFNDGTLHLHESCVGENTVDVGAEHYIRLLHVLENNDN